MENTTRPTITTGQGEKNPHGRELVLDPSHPAESLRAQLDELTGEVWWAPHSWRDDHRRNANWERASFLALDLDYHDGSRELDAEGRVRKDHVAVPRQLRARVESMLQTLSLPDALEMEDGQLRLGEGLVVAHPTPRGHRVVLTLRAPITDAALYGRALAGAARLMTDELKASGLLGVPNEEPGLCVDASARDLARMLWAPRAHPPKEKVPRDARCTVYGAPGARPFDALALAKCAPHDTPSARAVVEEPPHARWPDIRAAVSEGRAPADADRVPVRCLFHADSNPSAVVFASGRLHCSSCKATGKGPWSLDVWAREKGAEKLLGVELTRALVRPVSNEGRVKGDTLRPYCRTVGEWRWMRGPAPRPRWLLTVPASKSFPEERYVLDRGTVGMLTAGGGVGKSMALMQLAIAVATDTPWLTGRAEGAFPGFETHGEEGRVLLALGEENEAKAHLRMELLTAHLTAEQRARLEDRLVVMPLASVPVGLMADRSGRYGEEARAGDIASELELLLTEGGPWSLVILDPLSRFAGMETEVDNAAATRFVQVLERFTKAPGTPTVLVSHHTGQTARRDGLHDATAARGATALTDGVRWVATLTREVPDPKKDGAREETGPALLKMSVSKNNYGTELWPFWLARGEGGALRCAYQSEVDSFTRKDTNGGAVTRSRSEKKVDEPGVF
jgi:hypothetical protein